MATSLLAPVRLRRPLLASNAFSAACAPCSDVTSPGHLVPGSQSWAPAVQVAAAVEVQIRHEQAMACKDVLLSLPSLCSAGCARFR